jgi:hypothetical protein
MVTLLCLLLLLLMNRCALPSPAVITTPAPVPATAHLRIEVEPSGSQIFVDGLKSGTTPSSLTLSPGQHTVRIEHDGYEPRVETVSLVDEGQVILNGELIPLSPSAGATAIDVPTIAPEISQALPDLLLKHTQVELETGGACAYSSTELGVRIWVENGGTADAGPFVVEVNGASQTVTDGLAAGETISLWFPGAVYDGENTVLLDSTSQVRELQEENNTFSQRLPIPTLPPTCTPEPASPAVNTPTTSPPTSTPLPQPAPANITMREGEITIPVYPFGRYTDEAWSAVYNMPYPVLQRAAYEASNPSPANETYRIFVVENEYLRLTFLPDLGGRLYEVIYKPTGHHVTYRNPVLKPSPWGPEEQGWWLAAGGIEWCLPVEEHGYEWGVPWKLGATHEGDSVTVTLRDSDALDRVRAEIAVQLKAGEASFSIRPRLENPTGASMTVKYWTNAMLAPGGRNAPSADLHFVLSEAVSTVTVHSRGDEFLPAYNERMSWPIHNGTDYGRLGNWNRWLGFFADPALGGFLGVYDYAYDEGMVRTFSPDMAPGAKVFGFGWNEPIPPDNYTDDGSSYVEIHGGPAPTFDHSVTLPAGGQMQWTEVWYPVAGLGGLRYANGTAALDLSAGGGQAHLAVTVVRPWSGDVVLLLDGQEYWRQRASLLPGEPFRSTVPLGSEVPQSGRITLRLQALDGTVDVEYGTESTFK